MSNIYELEAVRQKKIDESLTVEQQELAQLKVMLDHLQNYQRVMRESFQKLDVQIRNVKAEIETREPTSD